MFAVDSLGSEMGSQLKVSKKILGYSENRVKDGVDGVGAQSLSRVRLRHPMDCSPPGSSVHGLLQAGMLEWVAIPSSRGSS